MTLKQAAIQAIWLGVLVMVVDLLVLAYQKSLALGIFSSAAVLTIAGLAVLGMLDENKQKNERDRMGY